MTQSAEADCEHAQEELADGVPAAYSVLLLNM
jgi:hypothetical protein